MSREKSEINGGSGSGRWTVKTPSGFSLHGLTEPQEEIRRKSV